MTRLDVYTTKGTKKGTVNMPKTYQEPENEMLLAQAIRVYEDRKHPGLSKTKTRGEVSLSTRKIYRQKGTGLARHGARSAPIFIGGGLVHGPKGIKRTLKLPKKMREKALKVTLSMKANAGHIFVVDDLGKMKKTKEAAVLVDKLSKKIKRLSKHAKFLFVLSGGNKAELAIRNLENAEFTSFKNLNAYDVFYSDVLIVEKKSLDKSGKKGATNTKSTAGATGLKKAGGKKKKSEKNKSAKRVRKKRSKTKK